MQKYKHIFFDLDRTLWDFDTNSRETFEDLFVKFKLRKNGIEDFDKFFSDYQKINHHFWDKYRKGLIEKEFLNVERFYQVLLLYRIDDRQMAAEMAHNYVRISPTKKHLFPNSIEILEYLTKQEYELHIITNGFPEVQHIKLKNVDLEKYFNQIIISEEVGYKKPAKEIFDISLQKANAKPNESVMIGDDLAVDILGGNNAGLMTIWVNYKNESGEIIPDYEVKELSEIERIL